MRVEDRELVALVFQEPVLGLGVELEAIRARGRVAGGQVALGLAVVEHHQAAGLVRLLGRDHHQTDSSITASGSGASQKGAERYFQPASARTATTTPSSSSLASLRAT